jgi:hypothetical protein
VGVALSSLVVGERIISRCEDGLLLAEYGLFDPSEVILGGNTLRGVRERGYLTTAERALGRLRKAGITPEIVSETFQAIRPPMMRALARSPSVLLAVDRLGPYEAFEGGVFRAKARSYEGTWLDLEALVAACPLRSTAELLQAMHLSLVLEEVLGDVPVRLLTANATRAKRAGQRTALRISFEAAPQLARILGTLRVPPRKRAIDDGDEVREELLKNLRARSVAAKLAEPRIRSLATIIARTGKTPPPMPSIDVPPGPAARAPKPTPVPIDLHLGDVPLTEVDPLALLEELRGHTQLLRGEDQLRAVAHHLSSMSDRSGSQAELGVLAARAWLAAGEPKHARHFARQVAENLSAADAIRLLALEILETTESHAPLSPPPVEPGRIVPMPILLASPHHQFAPSGASLPPLEHMPASTIPFMPAVAPVPKFEEAPAVAQAEVVVEATVVPSRRAEPEPTPSGEIPVFVDDGPSPESSEGRPRVEAPAQHSLVHVGRPLRVDSEIVESLALPDGLSEDMLPLDAKPTTADGARIAMTRLARALGRDYRLWYGTTLVTSVIAIEAMQRHLRRRFDQNTVAKQDSDAVEGELLRHGALLSEILARALGGVWVDVPPEKPGHWAMTLYPDIRVWPIGRIYRFFQRGHREADLVAFYLDLEAQVRRQA